MTCTSVHSSCTAQSYAAAAWSRDSAARSTYTARTLAARAPGDEEEELGPSATSKKDAFAEKLHSCDGAFREQRSAQLRCSLRVIAQASKALRAQDSPASSYTTDAQ